MGKYFDIVKSWHDKENNGNQPPPESAGEITNELVTKTPEQARNILKGNQNNRPINNRQVQLIIEELEQGRYTVNGKPIIIANTGRLLDGQHRLIACAMAEIAIKTFVVSGVDESTFATLGNETPRTASQVIKMQGHKYASYISRIAHLFYRYNSEVDFFYSSGKTSHTLIDRVVQQNEDLVKSVYAFAKFKNFKKMPSVARLMFCYFLFIHRGDLKKISKERRIALADDFFNKLTTGENLSKTSPVLHLRNRLLDFKAKSAFEKSVAAHHRSSKDYFAAVLKCWACFVNDKPMRQLKLMPADYDRLAKNNWEFI